MLPWHRILSAFFRQPGLWSSAGILWKKAWGRTCPQRKRRLSHPISGIPESFLPTYTSIIIAISLTGGRVNVASFLIGMLPLVFLLAYLGYLFYLRKIPKDTGMPSSMDKRGDILC